jgi:hypothetical protein
VAQAGVRSRKGTIAAPSLSAAHSPS